MSETVGTAYLPTNFREFLSVLEGLRLSSRPGRGMQHIEIRPVVTAPLRSSEETILCAGKSGEFPILLEVPQSQLGAGGASQRQAIPITSIQRAVVQSNGQREILLNRRLDNVPSGIVSIEIDSSLFALGDDPARFSATDEVSDCETPAWRAADQICGALAAALASAELHPEGSHALRQFLHEESGAVSLVDLFSPTESSKPSVIAAEVLRQHHGESSYGGELLLLDLTKAMERSSAAGPDLEKFRQHTAAVLASDTVRAKGSMSDEKNVLLRALALVVQRSSVEDILSDRIAGELPGPQVQLAAAALAGIREGLAHLPATLKAGSSMLLGTIAAAIENGSADLSTIRQLATAEGLTAPSDTPSADPSVAELVTFDVCEWRRGAVVKKALADLERLPRTWRLVLKGELLALEAPEGELQSNQAADLIAGWHKRDRGPGDSTAVNADSKASRPRKKRKAKTEVGAPEPLLFDEISQTDGK